MKKTFFLIKTLFILLLTTCGSYADLPVLNSTVNIYTAWALDPYNGLRTLNSFGQSFVATAPFLKSVGFNSADPSGTAVIKIYAFGSDSDPKGTTTAIYQLPIVGTASIVQFGQSVCSNWTVNGLPVATPYLNVGSTYYIEITNQNGGTIELGFSYNNSYGSGRAFNNGVISANDDLNLKIIGGYPSANNGLSLENYNTMNCSGTLVWGYFTSGSPTQTGTLGQTFIATSPYIVSATLAVPVPSACYSMSATIYEFNATTSAIGTKIGEACTTSVCTTTVTASNPYVLLNWNASGPSAALPYLKVGKKYYIEFAGWNSNGAWPIYSTGCPNTYANGDFYEDQTINSTLDLSLKITGTDYNLNEETVFNEWTSNHWDASGSSAGQTFTATTNYINEISANISSNGQLYIQLYEFGTDNAPQGALIDGAIPDNQGNMNLSAPIQLYGKTVCHFPPIRLQIGKKYYVKFLMNGNQTIGVSGTKSNSYSYIDQSNLKNYFYGKAYINGSIYQYSGQDVPLNMEIKGFLTGLPYVGYLNAISSYETDEILYNKFKSFGTHHSLRLDFYLSDLNYLTKFDHDIIRMESEEFGTIIGIVGSNYQTLPPSSQAFQDNLKLLAQKYKSRHIIWEIWNEPAQNAEFPSYPTDYIQFVKTCSQTIKQADPNALVATAGISGLYNWMSDAFIDGGLNSSNIDFHSYHTYFQSYPEDTLDSWLKTRKLQYASQLSGNFYRPHLLCTEYGLESNVKDLSNYCNNLPTDYSGYPWMYNVAGTTVMPCNSFGQTFLANAPCIRNIIVGTVPPSSGNYVLTMQVYPYNNSTGQIGTTPLITGTLPSVTVYAGDNNSQTFNFSGTDGLNNVVNLTKGAYYYIEFKRADGGLFSYKASTNDDYPNGEAFYNRSATRYNVDINMTINKAAIFVKWLTDLTPVYGREAGIYQIRYMLYHMSQGVAGTNTYRESESGGCDDFGPFYGTSPNLIAKPLAYGMKFLYNLFGQAFTTPDFGINMANVTPQYMSIRTLSKISSDGSLLVAIWKPLSATFIQETKEQLVISTGSYTGAVSIYKDLTANDYSTYTPAPYTDKTLTSNRLTINNIPVRENPIILKISKH